MLQYGFIIWTGQSFSIAILSLLLYFGVLLFLVETEMILFLNAINRPGVAGDVLQTPLGRHQKKSVYLLDMSKNGLDPPTPFFLGIGK